MENGPRYIRQIQTWIESCDRLHGQSCRSDHDPDNSLQGTPMWLIDTHQHCIVPGLIARRYVALSYVWPDNRTDPTSSSSPSTLLLERSIIEELQQPGFLLNKDTSERVPNVIRHAINLARALDERYLWVDRLCIVQDDAAPDGTLSQVVNMDKIYAGAWFVIVAAAPEAMYDRSVTTDWPSFHSVEFPWRTPPWAPSDTLDSEKEERVIVNVMKDRYGVLDQSKWATRGWTYQEQILSKRAVIFVESGLLWHCECSMWDGIDLMPERNSHCVAVRSQKIDRKRWPDFNLYLNTVCAYNGRQFSYPQDALLGIAGIFSALLPSFPDGFISGMPRLFLDHALLWQPFGVTSRRLDRRNDSILHSSLPSYSWCGWQCFVEPQSLRSGLSHASEASSQEHAGSWHTRHLVDWSIRKADSSMEVIQEPRGLDDVIGMMVEVDKELAPGWTRNTSDQANTPIGACYVSESFHETHRTASCSYPIPLPDRSTYQSDVTTSPQLIGVTMTATFFGATTLREVYAEGWTLCSASFLSVFDSKIFKLGPEEGKACPVLVLRKQLGGFAGLLQLMDNDTVEATRPLELIAISKGSANGSDMREPYLWTVFEKGRMGYRHDSTTQLFGYEPQQLDDHSKASLVVDLETAFSRETTGIDSCSPAIISTMRTLERHCENFLAAKKSILLPDPCTEDKLDESETLFQEDYGHRGSWYWHRNRFLRERIEAHEAIYTPFRIRREQKESQEWHWDPKAQRRWQARARWLTLKDMILNGSFLEQIRRTSPDQSYSKPPDLVCEFYNVLWVERKDGIAYRRACGWVPKHIWEAHATGPIEVTLD